MLARADGLRDALIGWGQGKAFAGFLVVVGAAAAATGAAAWLVRRFSPYAAGSGIPHVEAVVEGEKPPAPWRLMLVKFLGGVLAIGAGLALGREGPSVQMGATVGHIVGRAFRRSWADAKLLLAAGAGAGLATAFNAPVAGAVFVLEELVRRFDTRLAIASLGASAGALAVARILLGDAPDFHVEPLPYAGFGQMPLFLVLGVLAGLIGVAYNRTIIGMLAVADRLPRWPVELRASAVGLAVGALAWFAPRLVGGGDAITQDALAGTQVLSALSAVFLVRFALGSLSYAAGTPGGLFAPLLVLGAQLGLLFWAACHACFPGIAMNPAAFAVVGMAAFFAAVVRAPVTGVVLVTEMTASFTQLLPMLEACFAAMAVGTLLRNPPIYDSLRARIRTAG